MTLVELHPEHLLEREIAGALSTAERVQLDEHLRTCSSCRLERRLRADFQRELAEGPEPSALPALVSSALSQARGPRPLANEPLRFPALTPPRRRGRSAALIVGAAVALVVGAAAARPEMAKSVWGAARRGLSNLVGGERTAPASKAGQAQVATGDRDVGSAVAPGLEASFAKSDGTLAAHRGVQLPLGAAGPETGRAALGIESSGEELAGQSGSDIESSPGEELAGQRPARAAAPRGDVASSVRSRRQRAGEAFTSGSEPSPRRAVPTAASSSVSGRSAARSDAAEAFRVANVARRSGAARAASLYERLLREHPASPEARMTLAILARLDLDAGRARSAAQRFEAYLDSGDGTLREQAMAGLALAWQRLGEPERELQAWRALTSAYPRSSYAGLARRRLGLSETREAP